MAFFLVIHQSESNVCGNIFHFSDDFGNPQSDIIVSVILLCVFVYFTFPDIFFYSFHKNSCPLHLLGHLAQFTAFMTSASCKIFLVVYFQFKRVHDSFTVTNELVCTNIFQFTDPLFIGDKRTFFNENTQIMNLLSLTILIHKSYEVSTGPRVIELLLLKTQNTGVQGIFRRDILTLQVCFLILYVF